MVEQSNSTDRFSVRNSTDDDLAQIKKWLEVQSAENVEATFLCNWNLTVESHENSDLLVCIDETSNDVVAYQWGRLLSPGILEVRYDRRRQGIGRFLVDHCINLAKEAAVPILWVQCTPESSQGFWERMGFTVFDDLRNAYMLLPLEHTLSETLIPVSVDINFYSQDVLFPPTEPPLQSFSPRAGRDTDGTIRLERRISVFTNVDEWQGDPIVEVRIDGTTVCHEKAKYPNAQRLGVMKAPHVFFIDQLAPQDLNQ